ncbi:MAG: AAA family ATPase, partial [Planctomycetes bacterium]|nr:AAA family ATPase [Planctomycetota bacterium]
MRLRHLRIRNFRGIKTLDWMLAHPFVCLIGPGDSGKSTIVDAIDLVLTRRWNPAFEDSDFFGGDVSKDLVIEATIGELPRRMLSDALYGLRLRGIGGTPPSIHDEPEDGDDEVVTIRLSVASSLEPRWEVVTDRHADGMMISASERERFGVSRLGDYLERDLSWKRGSALARLTGEQDEHAHFLADADRRARSSIDGGKLPKMSAAAMRVGELAARFGVAPRDEYRPAVDPGGSLGAVGLSLHDGSIPVRRSGLGTCRLVSLAMQRSVSGDGGIVLVDEVESGLEPFRLRRLLAELRSPSGGESGGVPVKPGTVVMTSHSPVAIAQLRATEVCVVRTEAGHSVVISASEELQGVMVVHSEAMLSRRVLVCEGATEMGLVAGLDEHWTSSGGQPLALAGVGMANAGSASKVARVAMAFRELGYPTALLADSDEKLSLTPDELQENEVEVLMWDGNVCTEERIFLDLPWDGVGELVRLAREAGVPVADHVASAMEVSPKTLGEDCDLWLLHHDENALRAALGTSAKSKRSPWFKNHRSGVAVGKIVAAHVASIPESDLAIKIEMLREWVR